MLQKIKQFAGSSMGMLATGILCTTTVLLGWKLYIAPNMKRRRRDRNHEFAQFIIDQEQTKIRDDIEERQ